MLPTPPESKHPVAATAVNILNFCTHGCIEKKEGVPTSVCTHCYDEFGRAACSFTPNRRRMKREDEEFKAKFRPLLHIPPAVSKALDTVDPEPQLIPGIEADEVSDGEMDL